MATMRDIKRRKSSIESTEQITKAMKLVATVKLQKSRTKAENSRLYFDLMYQTIQEMLKKSTGIRHRYLKSGDSKKKAVIVVSSNRGLAGGYNSNIIRLVTESGIPKEDALIFAIGRKGRDGLARKGYEIKADYSDVIDEPLYSDAQQISKELLAMFEKNEIGSGVHGVQKYRKPDPDVLKASAGGSCGSRAKGRSKRRKIGSSHYEL